MEFNVGDEVWWFRCLGNGHSKGIHPGSMELVHDVIKSIDEGRLYCWHSVHKSENIWGKSRQEAWENLKHDLEKWGKFNE